MLFDSILKNLRKYCLGILNLESQFVFVLLNKQSRIVPILSLFNKILGKLSVKYFSRESSMQWSVRGFRTTCLCPSSFFKVLTRMDDSQESCCLCTSQYQILDPVVKHFQVLEELECCLGLTRIDHSQENFLCISV